MDAHPVRGQCLGRSGKTLYAVLCVVVAQGVFSPDGFARVPARAELRLPDRSVSVDETTFSASQAPGLGKAVVDVKVDSVGARSNAIARSDFTLLAEGEMFASGGGTPVVRGSRSLRATRADFD